MGGGGMGRSMSRPNFDPVLFNGPPPPEEMLDLVHLEAAQYQAYADQYRGFMESTKVVRDSVLEFRQQMRQSMEIGMESGPSRDPEGIEARRHEMDALQKQLQTLEHHQKTFDETLKKTLTEVQYQAYEKWRKDERARAEREMAEMMGGRPR
jgi:hypothetical protein